MDLDGCCAVVRCAVGLEVLSRFRSPGSVQLLDSVGRLRPAEDPEGEAALNFALHLAMRGLLPKARESGLANPGVLQSVFFPLDSVTTMGNSWNCRTARTEFG